MLQTWNYYGSDWMHPQDKIKRLVLQPILFDIIVMSRVNKWLSLSLVTLLFATAVDELEVLVLVEGIMHICDQFMS